MSDETSASKKPNKVDDGKITKSDTLPASVKGNPNATPNAGTSGANSPTQSGPKQ